MVTTLGNRRLARPTLPMAVHAAKIYLSLQNFLYSRAEGALGYGRQPPERSSSELWHV
jgi:hypothetical protein